MAQNELILYTTEDGRVAMQLRVAEGAVWLSHAEMAELFQSTKQNVSLHVRNILDEGELSEDTVVKDYLTTAADGKDYRVKYYNLDMILAVGYRVRSHRGTQFRQWATTHLGEYLIKGFVLDDARLKEPGGWDYFDELLERIRDIRASEKRFYQKVRDIYATAVDYDPRSDQAQLFFKKVQNKMLWAITGHTAAELLMRSLVKPHTSPSPSSPPLKGGEILQPSPLEGEGEGEGVLLMNSLVIAGRADAGLPNMGLKSWSGNRVRKQDFVTAKNYLDEREVDELNRVVVMYLDYAEDQAKRRKTMTMREWEDKLDAFLSFNERDILKHAGKVSQAVADKLAHECYEAFDAKRRKAERLAADREDMEELGRIEKGMRKRKTKEKKLKDRNDE